MEYVFGTKGDVEVLKTKGSHADSLKGYHTVERRFPDQTVTDSFRVVRILDRLEDLEENVYEWYEIDHHYRYTDRSSATGESLRAQIDYIAMMADIDLDTEVTANEV